MPARCIPDIPKYNVSREDMEELIELAIRKHKFEHKLIQKILCGQENEKR
jgi:hypothetical protein